MTYENIQYEVIDQVVTIKINRPDSYNALSMATLEELKSALKAVARDQNIRAVVLTGAGKAFSSGADLMEIGGNLDAPITELLRSGLNTIISQLRGLEKPTIAAVNGVAAGAGASLTLACDLRVASEHASFVFAAFVNIGLIPDAGSTFILQQMLGTSRAMELLLLADSKNRLTAEVATEYGLINRLVDHESFNDTVYELANKLAKMPTKAIGMTKRAVYLANQRTLSEALDYEARLQGVAFRTADFAEGVAAFLEKREPKFKGE